MAFDFGELSSSQKVTAVYVAYYGRAADSIGRDFWSNQLEQTNGDLSAIIDAFGTSPEAVQRFGTLSNEAAVRTLYRDLFNREPEQEGLDFFVGELAAGRLTLQTIALDILNGAQNTDATTASNKVKAGESYTDALAATGSEAEFADTRMVISAVNETDASVDAAQAAAAALSGEAPGISVQGEVLENGTAVTTLASPASATDVGGGSAGFLGVTDGTSLVFESGAFDNLQAGANDGGTGTILISGAGSTVVTRGTDNTIQIGRIADGTLLVSDGAQVETLQLEAGREGRGDILISGRDTKVTVTPANGRYSGEFSNDAGFVRAGREDGSFGRIILSDGALLEVVDTGETTGPGMNIAQNAGSRGDVIVDSSRLQFVQDDPIGEFGPFLNVGRGGEGTLDVRNGGAVTLAGETSSIQVGYAGNQGKGDGTLTVTGGGRVEALFYNLAFDGGVGEISVSGQGSTLVASGAAGASAPISPEGQGAFVTVGRVGSGTLTVEDGAQVQISTETGFFPGMQLGRNVGSEGFLSVIGSGSAVTFSNKNPNRADSDLTIGRSGNGEATIEAGGQVTGPLFVTLGRDGGSTGTLNISGPSSEVNITGTAGPASSEAGFGAFINVGRGGEGTLKISDGGVLTVSTTDGANPGINAARNEGSQATITIDGTGSRFEISGNGDVPSFTSGQAFFGRSGTADITISNGGEFSNQNNGVTAVGVDPDSGNGTGSGTVTVTGNGSLLDAGSNLVIGVGLPFSDTFAEDELDFQGGGVGSVTIADGGTVRAGDDINDGVADIFVGANGTLEIQTGATLVGDVRVVGGNFDLADGATHQGELII